MGLIRFLLAVCVVLVHSSSIFGFRMAGGVVAVESFFIISGFYMSLILNEKYTRREDYKLFITNRFLRIFPIYWLVLFLSVTVALIFHQNIIGFYQHTPLRFYNRAFLIFTNITIFFQDWVMFLGTHNGAFFFTTNFRELYPPLYKFLFISQAWTLGIELTFYLFAPFLLRGNKRIILYLIAASILLRIIIYYGLRLQHDPWSYRFFPTELVFFLIGNLCYRYYLSIKNTNTNRYFMQVLFGVVVFSIVFFDRIDFAFKQLFFYGLFAMSLPYIFKLTKTWKFDRELGELSYPIYISHVFIIGIMLQIKTWENSGFWASLFTILFSVLLNELVSKRIEIFRQKRFFALARKGNSSKQQ